MCFSAEASFAASGVLAAGSIAIARTPRPRASVPLSLFPAIFAAHQFAEGLVWLGQDGVVPDAVEAGAVAAYALIAYVLWPSYVPLAALRIESRRARRAVVLACQAIGLGVSFLLLRALLRQPPAASAGCCGLSYQVDSPPWILAPYLVAVSVPFLASSRRSLVLFGAGITLSCAAAALLALDTTFPSVWCFFAALLSGGLLLHFRCAARQPGPAAFLCSRPAS